MNADGTEPKKIRANAHYPAWSPDGSAIAFWENNNLNTIGVDLANLDSLDHRSDSIGRVSWAPSGFIAFTDDYCCGEEPSIRISLKASFGNKNHIILSESGFSQPAFSPDNRSLAFIDARNSSLLYVASADDSKRQLLTTGTNNAHPTWSPDSKRIAFQSNREGNSEIYVIDVDGTNLKRLTNNDVDDEYPTWSPDGNFIAFQSKREGRWGIYVMRADGTGEHRITDNSTDAVHPAWSPQP